MYMWLLYLLALIIIIVWISIIPVVITKSSVSFIFFLLFYLFINYILSLISAYPYCISWYSIYPEKNISTKNKTFLPCSPYYFIFSLIWRFSSFHYSPLKNELFYIQANIIVKYKIEIFNSITISRVPHQNIFLYSYCVYLLSNATFHAKNVAILQ